MSGEHHSGVHHSLKCPECDRSAKLYRSHAKNAFELFVKNVTPFRTYRCHDCGWRGYMIPPSGRSSQVTPRLVFSILVVFIIGLCAGLLVSSWLAAN
jgi:hypothetical protein